MNYGDWEKTVSETIRADSLWKMTAYRLASLLGDLAWHDVTVLTRGHRTLGLSDQLYRSIGSIGANIAEGYSMGTGKNRARYYEYALGSARESRDWYNKSRHVLNAPVVEHRMNLLAEIIRLLLTMIPQQRLSTIREANADYEIMTEKDESSKVSWNEPNALLEKIPIS